MEVRDMSRSLIPIDIIAADISGDFSDSVSKKKFNVTRHIINGYRRLHLFLLGSKSTQTVILPYDNAVNLPCDFLLVSKVGVRRTAGGCIAILSVASEGTRETLTDSETCDYLNSVWNGSWTGAGYPFSGVYGNVYGELYGMGRTVVNSGTYYVDKAQGILYVGSNIPPGSEIIVEYIGNGISNGLKVVPMEMKECLEFYAKWKYYADKNPSLSNTNYEMFKKEYNILKRFYQHKTPTQIATAVNESISPTNY